ncbi:hypothetical protein ACO0QE_003864 [Hanseniaspora vineae]
MTAAVEIENLSTLTEFDNIKLDDIQIDPEELAAFEKQFEEEYQISGNGELLDIDNFVVVDGAPVAPESKIPALTRVLTKLFSQAGEIVNFELPVDEEKKTTKGYLFVEYKDSLSSKKAIKLLDGKKLDAKHKLLVNSFRDMDTIASDDYNVEYQEPVLEKPVSYSELQNWVLDGKDQFVMSKDQMSLLAWYKGAQKPMPVVEPRVNWSDAGNLKFSPKGTFLISMHEQGVKTWGGDELVELNKFAHYDVKAVQVSKTEKYLVTFSPTPINDDVFFPKESQNHNIAIWDIQTGVLLKTFPLPPQDLVPFHWPMIKWSFDDKYCGRLGPNAIAVYEVENNFKLLDDKIMKIENVRDFQFAPAGIALGRNPQDLSSVLCYWTPEMQNQSCKATIMEIPRKRVLRTINLVQVTDVQFHWQAQAEYLCVQVDRHTKSKKSNFTNLEIVSFTGRDYPVEKIELKERVLKFKWEPKSNRFVTISIDEANLDPNVAVPQNIVQFFATTVGSDEKAPSWTVVYEITGKHSNTISWSPIGRVVVIGTLVSRFVKNSEFLFFDMDYAGEHPLNSAQWTADYNKRKQAAADAAALAAQISLGINPNQNNRNRNQPATNFNKKKATIGSTGPIKVNAAIKEIGISKFSSVTNVQWDSCGRFFAIWSSADKHKTENGYKIYTYGGQLHREEATVGFRHFTWRPRPNHVLTNAEIKKIRKNLKEYAAKYEEQDLMESNEELRLAILDRKKKLKEWIEYRTEAAEAVRPYETFDNFEYVSTFESIEVVKEDILEEKKEKIE